jgi:hypothetical protein
LFIKKDEKGLDKIGITKTGHGRWVLPDGKKNDKQVHDEKAEVYIAQRESLGSPSYV